MTRICMPMELIKLTTLVENSINIIDPLKWLWCNCYRTSWCLTNNIQVWPEVNKLCTSYRLLSLSLHDNRASHSRDTTWPRKFKVKGQGQRYPSQHSVQLTHFLSVSHQGIPSTPVPFVPWLSGLPFPRYNLTLRWKSKVKVKGTLVNVASSWLISFLFHINWTNHS